MTQSDLKFIERALAHPWMFWIYFWKWPRIVRQACIEYDFLAKERDKAKADHGKVARANEKLLNWVHVTHRLSTAPEGIRALFAAGKRLKIAILFLGLAVSAQAQLPPLLRNQWTTNAAPRAITTLLTNGVRVATNIWELDFTNSVTVTVSAVSNANQVRLAFIGSAASSSPWTNYTAIDSEGQTIYGVGLSNTITSPANIAVNFLTNLWGDHTSIFAFGTEMGSVPDIAATNMSIFVAGDYGLDGATFHRNYGFTLLGDFIGENANIKRSQYYSILGGGAALGSSVLTNVDFVSGIGYGVGQGLNAANSDNLLLQGDGALTSGIVQNSRKLAFNGFDNAANGIFTNSEQIFCFGYNILGSGRVTNTISVILFGESVFANGKLINCDDVVAIGKAAGFGLTLSGVTNCFILGDILSEIPVTREFWFGNTNNVYRLPGSPIVIGKSYFANTITNDTGTTNAFIVKDTSGGYTRLYTDVGVLYSSASPPYRTVEANLWAALTNIAITGAITNLAHSPLDTGQIAITNGNTAPNRMLKSLEAGSNVTLTDEGTNIIIAGTGGSGEATTNGTMQPFDIAKTWLVMIGDSITAGGAGVTAYGERVTNFAHWRGLAFYTNQAVGGTTFHIQTNVFWTNTLPLLPAVATNGTNVIISIQAGINDFNSGSNFLAMQASHQVFADALHSRGYLVVRTTMMPFEPNNDLTFSNIFRFNSWVRSASNYFDRVADFARRLPNSYDLDFWYVDRIHPTNSGQFELAKEWDTAVRFNTLPQPERFDKWQRTWQVHDSDGLMRVSIGSEFYGSNDISGIFFNGDNLSGNQTGIYITNNASPADMVYNVINQGNHVFREGNVEILRFGEAGLSATKITLTGTGTASSSTGLLFDDPGGSGNDVGIWRDSADARGIYYHSGIGGNVGFHKFTIGDTEYFSLTIPGGNPRLVSLATTNGFAGQLHVTNTIRSELGTTNAFIVKDISGSTYTRLYTDLGVIYSSASPPFRTVEADLWASLTNIALTGAITNLAHSPLAAGQFAITNGNTAPNRFLKSLQGSATVTVTDEGTNLVLSASLPPGTGDGAGIKLWTNQVAVGVGTNIDLIAGDNITILATNFTGAGGTNTISIGLTTSINTRQVGSDALTNVAAGANITNISHSPLSATQRSITNGNIGLDRGLKSLEGGDNITITDQGTNLIVGLTTSINTRQVGSDTLTNLANTKAFTNITRTVITNTGGSLYTVPSGATMLFVEILGGGGGGGGVDGANAQSAAGGGGGSGAYCATNISSPAASYIVHVGTNGLGGAAGNNAGTIGGTTIFTNILTALGGSGGSGDASAAAVGIAVGGAGALETATGSYYTGGSPGQNGICVSAALALSGGGAGSIYGGGGAPQTAAVGVNATGKGAGGSGAAVISNADRAGGNGSPGIIIITEYYK